MNREKGEAPNGTQNPATRVDTFRATRQFQRAILFPYGSRQNGEPYDTSQDIVVATIHYNPEERTVTITRPNDEVNKRSDEQ